MASFYTGKEPKCPGVLTVPIDDDHKCAAIVRAVVSTISLCGEGEA